MSDLPNFVRHSKTDPSRREALCRRCQGQNKVQGFDMPNIPWIWFEREKDSPMEPSLTLTFESPLQRLGYSLRGIIYAGRNHFTTRFRE